MVTTADKGTTKREIEGRDPEDPPQVSSTEITKIIGDKGLSIWAGFLGEEYDRELKPWNKEVRYILEARDDPVFGMLLDAIKMPLIRAEISTVPASDAEADKIASDWLMKNLEQMVRQSLRKWIIDTLETIEFGFFVGEIILEKRSDGRLWLRNIEPRGQETLRRWGVEDNMHPDTITHMIQGGFRGSTPRREVAIPLDKCLHVTWRGRKGSPQGKSLIRSLWIPYRFLKNFRVMEGIGIERDIGGVPMLMLPEGVGAVDNAELAELKIQMEGLQADQAMYMIIPEGMDIKPYNSGGRSSDVRSVIKDYEKQILMRMFAQFLALGMDNVGTQALVEGSTDFFTMAIESIQDEIMEDVNQQLVPYLFRYNTFPGTTGLPEIVWAKPGAMDVKAAVEALVKGAQAKIFTPTRDDEVLLRDEMGLPDLPEGVGEGPREVQSVVNDIFGGMSLVRMSAMVDEIKKFDQAAGQDLRTIGGVYERFTNEFQRDLVGVYDVWAEETARLAALPGRGPRELNSLINRRLDGLEQDLKLLSRARLSEAAGLGLGETLGKRTSSPQVQATVTEILRRSDENISTKLIPGIRDKFGKTSGGAQSLAAAEKQEFFADILATKRSRVAQQAGAAQVAIFETQVSAGKVENAERRRLGLAPVPTRWVLDNSAEHCEDDRGRATFGCPGLAREYPDGWDAMPTVPAGNTSCLGNCRCFIEADFGDGWKRIT